jgi:hypothetical protein
MRLLTESDIDRVVYRGNALHISTHNCGCCADHFTTDPDFYSGDFTITLEEIHKYVERLEDQVDELRGFLENNSDTDTITHKDDSR